MGSCWCIFAAVACHSAALAAETSSYEKACDGSAVVSTGKGHFLNASDEDNVIRLYRLGKGEPVQELGKLNGFLHPETKKNGEPKEVDIEAVARIGERLYWIGSHGNDGDGNREKSRERLFATKLAGQGDTTTLAPVGTTYDRLLDDFQKVSGEAGLELRTALKKPPKEGGISIEGLAPDGSDDLLIGFRSPLVNGRALVLPLHQAAAVVEKGTAPTLGAPVLLDLQGRGIRAIEPQPKAQGVYWVLAGPAGEEQKPFQLYEWRPGSAPVLLSGADLAADDGGPEGLMVNDAGDLLVARDGGEVKAGGNGKACKKQPVAQRHFPLRPAWPVRPPTQAAR